MLSGVASKLIFIVGFYVVTAFKLICLATQPCIPRVIRLGSQKAKTGVLSPKAEVFVISSHTYSLTEALLKIWVQFLHFCKVLVSGSQNKLFDFFVTTSGFLFD